MSAVVSYRRNTLVPFMVFTAKLMHAQSSFFVGCERIPRLLPSVSARSISTKSLTSTEVGSTILVVPEQTFEIGP